MKILFVLSILFSLPSVSESVKEEVCLGNCNGEGDKEECTFTFSINLYASELGYYTVEECGNEVMPILGMKKGITYKFLQHNVTNYKHPLGFAYFADGAHADVDELEPGVTPPNSTSTCAEDFTCPAPMYFLGDQSLGSYNNDPKNGNLTSGEEDFGLDHYEPDFFLPITDWAARGTYEVKLYFDTEDFDGDIFYFCHIHEYMTGRIKFVDTEGNAINTEDIPEIPYEYEVPTPYDQTCGTYNLEPFQLPNNQCPETFVCNKPETNPQLKQFSDCIDSMDCAMMAGMTTSVASNSEVALFIHQMIPHHQNAVNMAKALLKTNKLNCPDITEETDDCVMMQIMYHIINGQNHEIQLMRGVLESQGWLNEDDCPVLISDSTIGEAEKKSLNKEANSSTAVTMQKSTILMGVVWLAGIIAL